MNDIWHVSLYFFIYAFIGWLWETVYCSILERKFVYRGFLFGPYCPIYGFGALILLELLSPLKGSLALLFTASLVVMSILEYGTSFILEKLFNQRWWDYSNEKMNINGRIALKSSLFWGFISTIVVYFIHPTIQPLVHSVVNISPLISGVIIGLMTIDAIYTIRRLFNFKQLLNQMRNIIEEGTDNLPEKIHERMDSLRKSGRLHFTEKRLLKAFPKASDGRLPNYETIRQHLLSLGKRTKE